MKKNILLTLSLIQLTNTAQADFGIPGVFRIETPPPIRISLPPPPPIRIETPQIVKDINNGANNAGSQLGNAINNGGPQISNGVRDGAAKTEENFKGALAAVGNATGLSDILESNIETLSHIGRANACIYTLCLSEKLRADQIDEAKREARKQLDATKAQLLANERAGNRAEYEKTLQQSKKLAAHRLDLIAKKSELLNKEKQVLGHLTSALVKELDFRDRLHRAKLLLPPVSKTEMMSPSQEFQNNQRSDISAALKKLNQNLESVAKSTGRNQGQLLAEFIRVVEVATLKDLGSYCNNETTKLNEKIRVLSLEKQESEAELKSIEQAFLAGTK